MKFLNLECSPNSLVIYRRQSDHDQGDEDSDDDIQMRTAPEYQRLIAIHAGKGKGSTKDSLMNDPEKVRRLSMSEQKLEKAIVKHAGDIIRYSNMPSSSIPHTIIPFLRVSASP